MDARACALSAQKMETPATLAEPDLLSQLTSALSLDAPDLPAEIERATARVLRHEELRCALAADARICTRLTQLRHEAGERGLAASHLLCALVDALLPPAAAAAALAAPPASTAAPPTAAALAALAPTGPTAGGAAAHGVGVPRGGG